MFFGTRFAFKSYAAAQTAAHVGWLASFSGERIGGLVASSEHHMEIRPGKSRSGLLGLFHHLAQADARRQLPTRGPSRLNFLLGELKRVTRPGTDILLISDFIGANALSLQILATLCRHNQVFAYWISDSIELEAWPSGAYPIEDADERLFLDLESAEHRHLLQTQQMQHRQRVESLCSGFNIPLIPISCNRDVSAQIGEVLQARS